MQCEYRDNATGRVTAAESIADAWSRDGLDVDFREVDQDTWRPITNWAPYRAGTAALYAPATPTDAEPNEYVPPDPMLELDRDTMRRLGELADRRREDEAQVVAVAVAAYHAAVLASPDPHEAGATATTAPEPSNPPAGPASRLPHRPKETTPMRIAVKSAGGITECFVHVDNVAEGLKEAARQIADDYGVPTDIELWSDNPDAGQPRRLGGFRFVAVDRDGNVVDLD